MLNNLEAMKINTRVDTYIAHEPVAACHPTTVHVFLP